MNAVRLGLCAALLATAAGPAVAPAGACAAAASGPLLPVEAKTLTVSVAADKETYRRGQTAQVTVDVRRAVPSTVPAGRVDALVKVVLETSRGRMLRRVEHKSDGDGQVLVRWRVERSTPLGAVTAKVTAIRVLVPGAECSTPLVYEYGTATDPALTKVTR